MRRRNGIIRLLIVDDQPAVRRGLQMRLALEPDIVPVGEAADAPSALQLAAALRPDVVVMDVEMPGVDGITATAGLLRATPSAAVVILTLYDDAATRGKALAAGAAAVVSKRREPEELLLAIRRAARSVRPRKNSRPKARPPAVSRNTRSKGRPLTPRTAESARSPLTRTTR